MLFARGTAELILFYLLACATAADHWQLELVGGYGSEFSSKIHYSKLEGGRRIKVGHLTGLTQKTDKNRQFATG